MVALKNPTFETQLSNRNEPFQVVAQHDRVPICADSGEVIPLSSVYTEDDSELNATVYFLNRGDSYSACAVTEMPQSFTETHDDPFDVLCEIWCGGEEPLYQDDSLLVLPTETGIALAITFHEFENGQPNLSVSPRQISTESEDAVEPLYFPFESREYAPELVKQVGTAIGRLVNLMQALSDDKHEGRLTLSLPIMPDYFRFPSFEHFAGLDQEIEQLREVIEDLRSPELLKEYGLDRTRAILLQGPGGVGKTELAKAFVRELEASYDFVSISDITEQWVGKPVQNLRAIFDKSKGVDGPYVIFFDEFDGLFGKQAGGNSGVTHALVAEFKTILTNLLDEYPNVIVMAAANSIENFDPALLRPGRFDLVLKLPLPRQDTLSAIFGKLLNKHSQHFEVMVSLDDIPEDPIDTVELARQAMDFSGADVEAVVKNLLRKRMRAEQHTGRRPAPIKQAEVLGAIALHRRSRPSDI